MKQNPFSVHTDNDRESMISSMGLSSIEDLFSVIPSNVKLKGELNLPDALDEWDLEKHMRSLAGANKTVLEVESLLGGGLYDHHIPAAVDYLASRGEYVTSYTPYQPNMSQGSLQVIYEYQYAMSQLLGVPVVNASSYDGSTSMADAIGMAISQSREHRERSKIDNSILLSSSIWPQAEEIVKSHFSCKALRINHVNYDDNGQINTESLSSFLEAERPDAFVFQTPNKFGVLEKVQEIADVCKRYNVTTILYYHPLLSGIFSPPGRHGIDIVCGEGQPLGIPLHAGGASLGFLGCQNNYASYIPGRIVGKRKDSQGKTYYSLIREEREQHVSREKATSNICSNQALNSMRAIFYLSSTGDDGLKRLAHLNGMLAAHLLKRLCRIDGVSLKFGSPFFNELFVEFPMKASTLISRLKAEGVYAGIDGESYGYPNCILMAITETKSYDQLDAICKKFEVAIESNQSNKSEKTSLPRANLSFKHSKYELIGSLKESKLDLLEKPEVNLVRHYTTLSHRNYSVDQGMYPLGSCTMKYNPKRNDCYSAFDGFKYVHPLQPADDMQGVLELLYNLEGYLCEIMGMDGATLQPAAGAQGELTGLLMMRQFFSDKKEDRDILLIADSAHGTNPSSATMAGYKCEIVSTNKNGMMDLDDLKRKVNSSVAGLMITNPSTLGLFEERIADITEIVHQGGGLVYCDGANMNALMGLARPGDMGFDLAHINTHKTFSTPHGGGGPGAGPLVVKKDLVKYFPKPRVTKNSSDNRFEFEFEYPGDTSTIKLKQYFGHVSVLIRAYSYIRSLGGEGLRQASKDAILNANYIQHHLKEYYPPVFDKICMHECLLSANRSANDSFELSRLLMTHGIHPPTLVGAGCVWYPEELKNSMLIEPTETEDKATLDEFIKVMISGFKSIESDKMESELEIC
jgi:glycine cleavage system protein P-like pyridoxal-binding family